MMRALLDRIGRLALWASAGFALCACFDTRLSLGHHEAPGLPQAGQSGSAGEGGSGGTAAGPGDMMADAAVDPLGGTGGQGGSPMEVPDAGPPPAMPCDEGTYAAQLDCQVEDGFFGGPQSEPMSTRTTLTITPRPDRPGVSRASGVLRFSAWTLEFEGRIEGQLDCVRGVFDAFIVDGVVMMPNAPPGPFFGQVDGLLDPVDGTISGPWWHGPEMQSGPRCTGPWRATRN